MARRLTKEERDIVCGTSVIIGARGRIPTRFGGERISSNSQIQADKIEPAIWAYVCKIVRNPRCLEQVLAGQDSARRKVSPEDVEALRAQRQRLRHGMERLIDSLAEGMIDKDQFTVRMIRAKTLLADLDSKIASEATNEERHAHLRSAMTRLTELSTHLQSQLNNADWATKREIIRAIVQRIEIGPTNIVIVLRLPTEITVRGVEPIVVTLSRV
jgi:site-specific DNA recombinase